MIDLMTYNEKLTLIIFTAHNTWLLITQKVNSNISNQLQIKSHDNVYINVKTLINTMALPLELATFALCME